MLKADFIILSTVTESQTVHDFFFLRKKICSLLPVVKVWDILKNLGYNCKSFLIQKLVKTYQKHQFQVLVIIHKSFKMCNFIKPDVAPIPGTGDVYVFPSP